VLHKTFATSRRRASPLPDRDPATKLYLLRVAEYARHVGPQGLRELPTVSQQAAATSTLTKCAFS
jgi:hypothetical protein